VTTAEVERLEQEAEEARARLIGGLAKLRSNDQFSQVKQRVTSDLVQGKGGLLGQAKSAARHQADSVMDEIKARIAANPGAALAIAAGLGWRLYRHPPIATMLVGAGLMALMRTDPQHRAVGADAAARAMNLAGSARHRVQEWRGASEQADGGSESTGERIRDMAETTKERVSALSEMARERAVEWKAEAGRSASRRLRQAAIAADRWTAGGQRAIGSIGDRDRYLLGAAALALAAAVGIAAQRRMEREGLEESRDRRRHA
jgi:hypothetical protein